MNKLEQGVEINEDRPETLYHGSVIREIKQLRPRQESVRDKGEGAVVFATPDIALASICLFEHGDSWTYWGKFNGVPYIVISDQKRFLEDDSGGAIYSFSSEGFDFDLDKGMGDNEWTSSDAVAIEDTEEYDSALKAMLENGVQVYFIDKETFEDVKVAEDHGRSILTGLESENQKRGINIRDLNGPED